MENTSKRSQLMERTRTNSIMMLDSALGNAAAVLDDIAQAMARADGSTDTQNMPTFMVGAQGKVEHLAEKLKQPNGEKIVDSGIDFAARYPAAVASGAALLAGVVTYVFASSAGSISAEKKPKRAVSSKRKSEVI